MKSFILSNRSPIKKFEFKSLDGFVKLVQATLVENEKQKSDSNWAEIMSNVYLEIELKFIVNKELSDERSKLYPLLFEIKSDQIQPVVLINHVIKTELFSLGITHDKFYRELTILLKGKYVNATLPEIQISFEEHLMKEV